MDDQEQIDRLRPVLQAQRAAFAAHPFATAAERKSRLRALIAALRADQERIVEAIRGDFGVRPRTEIRMAEVMGPVLEARHAIAHLSSWMRPRRRSTELLFLGNSARVVYQPLGVVGVIAPWNFPAYLSLGPLIAALAAGNRVMIKVSEYSPRFAVVLRELLAKCFPEDEVAVFDGGPAVGQAFSRLPFDHLVFTGSPAVGRHVMRAAADNLVPLTLELGGKSPAIIAPGADLAAAALSIAHGKAFNAGQVCVSPDYALVPRGMAEPLAEALTWAWEKLVPTVQGNPEYTSILDDRQAARIRGLLEDARAKGARVVCCSRDEGTDRRMPLQVVLGATPDMRILQEEIFGPVLPVLEYDDLEAAYEHVRAGERPLALYAYGLDAAGRDRALRLTHSGGVTFDDWGWHVFQHDLPFGGVGNSGQGTYHGIEGFRALSHARAVFVRRRWFPVSLFHPPYGRLVQRLALRLYLGASSPSDPDGEAAGASRSAR